MSRFTFRTKVRDVPKRLNAPIGIDAEAIVIARIPNHEKPFTKEVDKYITLVKKYVPNKVYWGFYDGGVSVYVEV